MSRMDVDASTQHVRTSAQMTFDARDLDAYQADGAAPRVDGAAIKALVADITALSAKNVSAFDGKGAALPAAIRFDLTPGAARLHICDQDAPGGASLSYATRCTRARNLDGPHPRMISMQRRPVLSLLGGALATLPLAARAKQGTRVIGVLMAIAEGDPEVLRRLSRLTPDDCRSFGRGVRCCCHSARTSATERDGSRSGCISTGSINCPT